MHQFATIKKTDQEGWIKNKYLFFTLFILKSIYSLPVEEGWVFPPLLYPIVIFWVCQGGGMTDFVNVAPLCPFA